MFTGLIQEIGRVRAATPRGDGVEYVVAARMAGDGLAVGESVALDGACLTVERVEDGAFAVFASGETLQRTTLGGLRHGGRLHLERALALGDRLGGHLVQGHVDGVGRIEAIEARDESRVLRVAVDSTLERFLVEKGSVAVAGVSLTIADLAPGAFSVWIIPETWRATTMPEWRVGGAVNIECDLIGKYVFRYLETQRGAEDEGDEAGGGRVSARDIQLADLLRRGGWGAPRQG